MNVVESVEYFPSCPQCGASNNGKELCEYCGTSLVKRRINQSIGLAGFGMANNSLEEENMMEDSDLREISGKSGNLDPFIIMFCLIFGGCFCLVPIIIGVAFTGSGIMEPWVFLMLGLFLLIGLGSLAPLVIAIISNIKCKTGEPVSGIVRGYSKSMVSVNGSPVLNMRLLMDENDEKYILVLRSGSTERRYKIGSTVHLKRYKNKYIIDKEKMRIH